MQTKLGQKAVLMRLSIGCTGESRQDRKTTAEVQSGHNLGSKAGKWVKNLYPPDALKAIKKLDGEARSYHDAVTLPFDAGVGILPAALVMEYSSRMKDFASRRESLVKSEFVEKYDSFKEWAKTAHNGTFDASDYPGAVERAKDFTFKAQPLPVPDSTHFCDTVASLLGVDVESVDRRVNEAALEAQRELLRRMTEPVRAMVNKFKQAPKANREDIIFRDSLVGNLADIVRLAPKLNLSGDTTIDGLVAEMEKLVEGCVSNGVVDTVRVGNKSSLLRESVTAREQAKADAEAVLAKLAAYQV